MRRINIRELHEHTGKLVRAAASAPLLVTDRGRTIAVIKAPGSAEVGGKPWPKRRLSSLPKVAIDSTALIAQDRE